MALTIPNTPGSPTAEQSLQSAPDQRDFDAMVSGYAMSGVASGCAVVQRGAGANMSVDVGLGVVLVVGTLANVVATNLAISNGDATNPRFDLICVNNAGTPAVTAGTAAANPVFPAIPASNALLAAVYVAANQSTSVVTADIVDKRVIISIRGLVSDDLFTRWNTR